MFIINKKKIKCKTNMRRYPLELFYKSIYKINGLTPKVGKKNLKRFLKICRGLNKKIGKKPLQVFKNLLRV